MVFVHKLAEPSGEAVCVGDRLTINEKQPPHRDDDDNLSWVKGKID
jgi:hypothetical protein